MKKQEKPILKSCPFCGGEARLDGIGAAFAHLSYVECKGCGATTEDYRTDKEAIEAWNRRE